MDQGRGAFGQCKIKGKPLREFIRTRADKMTLEEALTALDFIHMAYGLMAAYGPDYPLVEPRELIPSFDAPLIEYKNLPAFGLVILDRPLKYQQEGFQFDILLPEGRPVDVKRAAHNRRIIRQRLPRDQVPKMDKDLGRKALTPFSRYVLLLPHLLNMDRGHVIAREKTAGFGTLGVFASFPSDLDGEIKKIQPPDRQVRRGRRHALRRQPSVRLSISHGTKRFPHLRRTPHLRRPVRPAAHEPQREFRGQSPGAKRPHGDHPHQPGGQAGPARVEKAALVGRGTVPAKATGSCKEAGFGWTPRSER